MVHRTAISERLPARGWQVEVDDVADRDWDAIAAGFADINPEQTAAYATKHWKGRDSHLLLRRDGEPAAGARVAVVSLPLIGRGLAFLRFGPFWRRQGAAADPETYRAVIAALTDEYCVRRGHCLTVLPRPHPDHQGPECEWLRAAGFVRRRAMDDAERYFVDAALSDDEQFASLAKQWRYNLRQGLSKPLTVRLSDDPAEVRAFQDLYLGMKERKHFSSTTPVHLTGELMARLPEALKPRLAVAVHEGALVAGAVIGLFGDTAYYMFGATAAAALPLQAGYALQWWVWRWLRAQGIRWYDLGGAAHEPGLRHFKKGFCGRAGRVVVMEGEFDRWTAPLGRLSADAVLGLRQVRRRIRHGAGAGNAGKAES